MPDVGIEPPLCHPHKCLVGIHLKGNEDGCPMTTVGHDERGMRRRKKDGCLMTSVGYDVTV